MRLNLKHLTRVLYALVVGMVMIGLPIIGNLSPKAHADGETYTWVDKATIQVTGGITRGDVPPGVTANRIILTRTGLTDMGGGALWIQGRSFSGGSGCLLSINAKLLSNQSADLTLVPPKTGSGTSTGASDSCVAAEYSSGKFTNRTVSIQGIRPSPGSETDAQKKVDVEFFAPAPYGSAPNVLNVTLKDGSGKTVKGPEALPKIDNTSKADTSPQAQHEAIYNTSYTLDEGDYQVCPDYVIPNCQAFHKVKFQPLTGDSRIIIGQSQVGSIIQANVFLNFTRHGTDPALTVGPYDIKVTNTKDNSVQTFQTDSHVLPPPGAISDANPIPSTSEVQAYMQPFDPGEYKICLAVLDETNPKACQTATKKPNEKLNVDFKLEGQDAQDLLDASASNTDNREKCETNPNPLTFILCGIFNGLSAMSDFMLANVLQPLLATEPVDLSSDSPQMQIWSQFRIIANIILVAALLVIVFGESIGGGLVDAYTAKKALPRVLFSAILINLSIYIAAFMVDLTNILGSAIGNLIIAPVRSSAQFHFTPDGLTSATVIAGGAISAGLIAIVIGGHLGGAQGVFVQALPLLLVFVVLPIFLAITGMFLLIIIRQALILFLIVVSPIAFALYCLPNTERYFRRWWDWFWRALLVYIIIMAIFGISDLATVIIQRSNDLNDGPLLNTLVPSS